ncbi:hypothetical protein KEM54_001663 [Ascosphaera aggregata]|nr:hypothetical protein KEM54_001663 [Ascosphaera aggregata]
MAFGRITRSRENKASHSHKKKDSVDSQQKSNSNSRSDSPYHLNGYTSSPSSGQISSTSQNSSTRRVVRPPPGHLDDDLPASLPHSSSSQQGWYDEASAGQKAEDCLKAESNGHCPAERPPLQFPDKLNAETAARLHSAFSSLIDRMEQQGRMKFNTKPKPCDAPDSGSNKASKLRPPDSQLPSMQGRGTAGSYKQGNHQFETRSNLNQLDGHGHPSRALSIRVAQNERLLPPLPTRSHQQSTAHYHDYTKDQGHDNNPDSPTDPYSGSTYPPVISYHDSALAKDARSRSSSNPQTDGITEALLQQPEAFHTSSESSRASRTRNALGLKISTAAMASQSKRSTRWPTVASNGKTVEQTPCLVHDERKNESDETVPVCDSPSPFDIGNSPTIRQLDDPFNATYQEPITLQSPPQKRQGTPVATSASSALAYNADEILQIVQQALLQTQASTQAISMEAIQAAVMNEMNYRLKVNGSMSSGDGTRHSNDGASSHGRQVPPRTPESCFSNGTGQSSPAPIMLPPPSLDTSRNWSPAMRMTVPALAERDFIERQRTPPPRSHERDDESELEESPRGHHYHCPPHRQEHNRNIQGDTNTMPWPNSRHTRRGFRERTATNLSGHSSANTTKSDLAVDPYYTNSDCAPSAAPSACSFNYPELEAYPDFDIPIGLPESDSFISQDLRTVPTGRSRGMSTGEKTRFESAAKRPSRPYNSSPFAVGANHDRVPLSKRGLPMQN